MTKVWMFAEAGPPSARCRQACSGNASSSSVLAKASGASANARRRSSRSAPQSAARACRTSMSSVFPAPERTVRGCFPSSWDLAALVRAWSAQHREPLILGGDERSRWAYQDRRSHGIHRSDLGRPTSLAAGSNPSRRATNTA
jgi:hypothetical protein